MVTIQIWRRRTYTYIMISLLMIMTHDSQNVTSAGADSRTKTRMIMKVDSE